MSKLTDTAMQKHTLTFDQLPEYVYELGRKVDLLATLISSSSTTNTLDEIGGIELACQVTRLSKARLYTLVSDRAIPHKKRGNRLTFRRSESLDWLDKGQRTKKEGVLV